MNTNLHECFLEPRKARNTRKVSDLLSRFSRVSRLKMNSALSPHTSSFGEAAWLKEIQR